MAAKKKKKKPKYNKESAIISAIKRTFSRSPFVSDLYSLNRYEFPKYNKDGSLSKKPAVRYKCVECKEWHMRTNTQADHPQPVVPLNIPMKHACMDVIMGRLWVKTSELQILCKPCHKVKSKEENAIRREWKSKTKEKHLIYRTTNSVNGKFYIGVHSTFDYDDGYMGNGKALKAAIKKYGKDKFYRKILFVYDSREDAFKKEAEIVNDAFVKNNSTYNLTQGGLAKKGQSTGSKNGNFGGKAFTDEIKAKIGNRHYPTGKNHKRSRQIYCVELDKYFDSITEAKRELGSSCNINRALKNGTLAGGYHWQYAEKTLRKAKLK